MAITLRCACGARLRAPDDVAGRSVRCPRCGAELGVPPRPGDVPAPVPRARRERGAVARLEPEPPQRRRRK